MKFNHPHTVLWDEMDTLRREDSASIPIGIDFSGAPKD